MSKRDYELGEAELEVLRILWEDGPLTVREVLARLLKLNHERHEEETRQVPQAKTKGSRGRKKQKTDPGDLPLFGTEGA